MPPKRGAPKEKAAAKERSAPKAKAAPPEPEPEEDYASWSMAKLKDKLKELGGTTGGGKDSLIERIKALAPAATAAPKAQAAAKRSAPAEEKVEQEEPAQPSPKRAKAAPEPKAKARGAAKEEPEARGAAAKKRDAEGAPKESAVATSAPSSAIQASAVVHFEDGSFKAEYAKSSRSACKRCQDKIAEGALRIAKMVPSDKFDGMVPLWYHAQCFLTGGLLPRSTQMIGGFSTLRPESQDEILKMVPNTDGGDGGGQANEELQAQNKKVFEVIDAVKELPDSHQKAMLELNDYPTQNFGQGTATKAELLADGILFGATAMCPECNDSEKGKLLLSGEAYRCRGSISEFLRCTYKTQTPERKVWKLTEAAKQVADGKLKKMRLKTGERLFASELKSKGEDESTVVGNTQEREKLPPFLGLTIVVAQGSDEVSKDAVEALIRKHGGITADTVTKATTFVVSGDPDAATSDIADAARELGVPGLSVEFVTETAESEVLQEMDNHLVWGEARRLTREVQETATSKFVEKAGVQMDADVGELVDRAHVLVDKASKTVYSEMLSETDIVSGRNSFYTLYLLEQDAEHGEDNYWVFRKWGRIGVSQGGTKIEDFGSNKEKALKSFRKLYLDKTGNEFGHAKDAFVHKAGKMSRLDVTHKALQKGFDPNAKTETSGDGGDQPLGKLSKAQIEKGDAVLDEIQAKLNEGVKGNQILAFSAKYYSLVPHNFGMKKPPPIDNEELLGAEKALLQFYLRMGFEDVGGEEEAKLTPIAGVMELDCPKTLNEAANKICGPSDIKSCSSKGAVFHKKKAGSPTKPMTPDLYGSILLYTSNAIYKELNKVLRDEDRAKVSRYFPYLRLLFEATGRLPTKKQTLWRGIGVDLSSQYKVGSTIIWWGVSSCTSDQKVARNFMAGCGDGATFLTIECQTACDISAVSVFPNEAESILLPGTQFEVLKAEKKGKQAEITLRETGRVVN